MELAFTILSLVVGIVSIVLAIFSMVTAKKTEKKIMDLCEEIKKLIRG